MIRTMLGSTRHFPVGLAVGGVVGTTGTSLLGWRVKLVPPSTSESTRLAIHRVEIREIALTLTLIQGVAGVEGGAYGARAVLHAGLS